MSALSDSKRTWREQYKRMLRLRERLYGEYSVITLEEEVFDNLYFFTVTCYHLLDWLMNDPSKPIEETTIGAAAERYVKGRKVLEVCRDICHGSKHAVLRGNKENVKTQVRMEMHTFPGSPMEKFAFQPIVFVDLDGEFIPAQTFADLCIEEWDNVLWDIGLDVLAAKSEKD